MEEPNFTAPWAAIERAVDQCIDVYGIIACSRLLEGSNCPLTDPRASSKAAPVIPKRVTFTDQIELLFGSDFEPLSHTKMTHDELQAWRGKPWTLHVDPVESVVEPLSLVAVSIPTDFTRENVSCGLISAPHDQDACHAQTGAASTDPTFEAIQEVTDSALYDMDQSWHLQLRVAWREFATVKDPDEGRTMPVISWYLHHHDAPRCASSRSLTLDRMDHLWLTDLRELWADHIRAGEVLHITGVIPTPPRDDSQPYAPHVILTQGLQPDRIGTIMTACFIEDHRTHLLQEAISSPPMMSGTRAVDLLRVDHVVQGRRWVARSGVQWFDNHELEEIPDGISIVVDIRVPSDEPDATSFAAWSRANYPPDQPVFMLPRVVQPEGLPPDDVTDASSSDEDETSPGVDWRFVHIYRTRHRVHHGHLPWDDAFEFQHRVSQITGAHEDDIAFCHHVEHPPQDLQAAHTEVLLMQSVSDLAIGSIHRLVLVDIEFHEHPPATDHSTSRRCLSLPHVTQRRSLLRLLGLDIYCDRVRKRCAMWLNNEVVPLQRQNSFYLEHGDYLRIAIPPLPSADAATSTRTCVSHSRPRSHRLRRQAVDLRARLSHETGMTDVDAYDQPSRRNEPADDDLSLIQYDIGQFRALLPTTTHMLATETATLVSNSHCGRSYAKFVAKLDDAPTEQVQQARDHVLRRDPLQVQLAGQPEFIGELLQAVTQRLPHFGTTLSNAIFVETWFSDHVRRPHSGIGRVVRLEADFRTWYTAIVMAWEDHIDPFQALACYIADPQPDGGDPEVMVHLVLVQQAQPNRVTTLVSISDTAEDPWHPRLMCLTLSQTHLRQDLLDLVDLDHRCATSSPDVQCRMWWHEHEITPEWHEPLPQAATLLFSVQHAIPWHQPAPHSTDDEDEAFNLLQTKCQRKQLRLDDLVESCVTPSWVTVNCHKVIFLRQ